MESNNLSKTENQGLHSFQLKPTFSFENFCSGLTETEAYSVAKLSATFQLLFYHIFEETLSIIFIQGYVLSKTKLETPLEPNFHSPLQIVIF